MYFQIITTLGLLQNHIVKATFQLFDIAEYHLNGTKTSISSQLMAKIKGYLQLEWRLDTLGTWSNCSDGSRTRFMLYESKPYTCYMSVSAMVWEYCTCLRVSPTTAFIFGVNDPISTSYSGFAKKNRWGWYQRLAMLKLLQQQNYVCL